MTGRKTDADPRQLVLRRKQHVQRVRDRVYANGVDGKSDAKLKQELALAALSYWDVLRDYRFDEDVDAGGLPDIAPVRERLDKTKRVRVESKRLGQQMTTREVPAISELDTWRLIEITEQLDDFATALGFSAMGER